jgi:catechol 2,3-dioxygenase-like lactoylglutathione lyase family enzyme
MDHPAIAGILETALYAPDLGAARDFYARVLGLPVISERPGRHVFFRCGPSVLLLFAPEVTAIPPENGFPVPTHGAHGPGHVCFTASRAAIDTWRAILATEGMAVEAEFDWPNGARSLYIRDPAGNSVEFAEPHLWG